jgi:hypothetical protein
VAYVLYRLIDTARMKVVLVLLSIPLACLLLAWLACVVLLASIGDRASAGREADDFDYSPSDHYLDASAATVRRREQPQSASSLSARGHNG